MRERERDRHMRETQSGLVGDQREVVDDVELPAVRRPLEVEPVGGTRVEPLDARGARVLRRLLAAPVFPGQPPAGERAPHEYAHAVAPRDREHVALHAADQDRVGRLLADELREAATFRRPMRLDEVEAGERRRAQVAHLALPHEVGQGAERLFDVGREIRAVDLVQVDVIGVEPPQRVLDLARDPQARVAALVRPAHWEVHLRREHDVVAAAFECLSDDLL